MIGFAERLSASNLVVWERFYEAEPWGFDVEWQRGARLIAELANRIPLLPKEAKVDPDKIAPDLDRKPHTLLRNLWLKRSKNGPVSAPSLKELAQANGWAVEDYGG